MPIPIIGNLLQLNPAAPHKTMLEWSKKYGSVFTFWMGSTPAVVVTDHSIMKEHFTGKQGDIFSARPDHFVFETFLGGK